MARKLNWSGVALSVVTGTSLAAVTVMGYVRYQHPEEFAQGSVKQSRPETWDEQETSWGAYGSGLSSMIPSAITNVFQIENIPERVEAHRKRRREAIDELLQEQPPR
ncbi:Aste57867_14714 [Aphanomyces stellatus]|uniref:Aste57867_14714 protein n=1 Tax=Aphanomyces stellatus TaxID=120398 RepID=A0A485L2C0_9STRA|nr:hypothetical protein As57867_014659 [Aphanomyces stellatus]VFT91532.1 Aste57867_14714 [Aphanomyces stellatus]